MYALEKMILHRAVTASNAFFFRLLATLSAVILLGSDGMAGGITANDEFWVVTSCGLTSNVCRADLSEVSCSVFAADDCGRFNRREMAELYAGFPAGPTAIYVHGNRFTTQEAIERGQLIYRKLACCRPDPRPLRWIVYVWPAERAGILLADIREKARRTEAHGLYLGALLSNLAPSDQQTTVIGYSYGARVATGAFHAAGGGQLQGRQLELGGATPLQMNLVLVAPAVNHCWLSSHGYHRNASNGLNELAVFYNSLDPVLKAYWLVDGKGAEAMGNAGLGGVASRSDGLPVRIRSYDRRRSVGASHDELQFYQRGSSIAHTVSNVIWQPAAAERPAAQERRVTSGEKEARISQLGS